ncbi:hypothetical protein [Plantibacter flavus]|uniref:hypothetical protein n=1 Tax=Plantibacter flavus TaxID=150123 RepID=UPI001294685C|nr:hypothetical protein [Plantibacter flavus]
MDPWLTLISSVVVASVVTAASTLLLALHKEKREDGIRAEAKQDLLEQHERDVQEAARIRREEREFEAARHAQQLEEEREVSLRRHGVRDAQDLLDRLGKMQAAFAADPNGWGSYKYDSDLANAITVQARKLPDAHVRDVVVQGVRAINHTWLAVSHGELDVPGKVAQRNTLSEIMDSVGAYIVGDDPKPEVLEGLIATNDLLDSFAKDDEEFQKRTS